MTVTDVGKIETIPSDILLRIFSLATGRYDPRHEPFIGIFGWAPSMCTELSKDLRVKKVLVRVCKTWRNLALESLYRRIYIHRVRQLFALLVVLEKQAGYRDWIQHIHGVFTLEGPWESTYVKNVQKLLMLCSSCREFSWHPLDETYEYVVQDRYTTISILCNMPTVPSSFHSLRKLSITLDFEPPTRSVPFPSSSVVNFPNLEELVCKASLCAISTSLDIITRLFILPNLRLLTITPSDLFKGLGSTEDPASVCNLLERHGGKLTAFTLEFASVSHPIQKGLEDLLKLTPNLVSIKLFPRALVSNSITFASPHASLRTMELYVNTYARKKTQGTQSSDDPCSVEGFLSMAANRANFPGLQSVAILDARGPEYPFGDSFDDPEDHAPGYAEASFQYFLPWAARLHKLDIALLRVDRAPLISPEQEERKAWKLRQLKDGCSEHELKAIPQRGPEWSDSDSDAFSDAEHSDASV